jgi:Tol biopolymer transport system component
VAEGVQDADPTLVGVYTARSSDGGDLVQLTVAPTGGTDRPVGGYSPDGSRILFVRPVKAFGGQDASQDLFVVNTDGASLIQLNPPNTTTGWREASWSPDGRAVTFVASRGRFLEAPRAVFVVDADGADPRRITPWGDIDGAQWSPDGRWIAFSEAHPDDRDLFLVQPDGTGLTQITDSTDGLSSSRPVWAPDGSKLVFVRSSTGFPRTSMGGPFDSDLWMVNADGTGLIRLTHRPAEYYQYAWAGTGTSS